MTANPQATMSVAQFQHKWRGMALKERSASQSHFNDLCHMLGVPTPTDADPTGDFYTFERGAEKTDGGAGWADVWFRGHFAWEYKGHHADLTKAYGQLLLYREDLENPPLLVVCDLDRFEVHTNFTGTAKKVYSFSLANLDEPANLATLRALWSEPSSLRPDTTPDAVTREAAERFGKLAASLHARGVTPRRTAHFLVQLLFCFFAEDVGLLPRGLFTDLLARSVKQPERFPARIEALLTAMRDGGDFGAVALDRFNGGLFATVDAIPLTGDELATLAEAGRLDWASVEPAIFGTLFERSLDPSQRAQLGAHYTGRADIERVVEPVVLAPLRRRWAEVRARADTLKAQWQAASETATRERRQQRRGSAVENARTAFANALFAFQEELASVRILDPACGSGNFLYVALAGVQDLEKAMITYGADNGISLMFPRVGPTQLFGLEVNEYARELAQVVIWIGYLQWMTANGFQVNRDPVLEPMETIRLQDALLDLSDPEHPKEAAWPAADFIIGNPPFLGGKRLRTELGDEYVDDLFAVYNGRVPREADLVAYFIEKARQEIAQGNVSRAGLLATNSIRGGANRNVLDRIADGGGIFMAWSDEPWILSGAAVRISIVGFDDGTENTKTLNGQIVERINTDLTATLDATKAEVLSENAGIAFQGPVKVGKFDIDAEFAARLLAAPVNPNGRPNSDVVRPWVNGMDIVRRPQGKHIIDFGVMSETEAAFYELPFEYVRNEIRPSRETNRDIQRRTFWWRLGRSGAEFKAAAIALRRVLFTPRVASYRLFVWSAARTLPDSAVVAFARDDDYFFGVLQSRVHEAWSLRMGTWLGVGNDPRYTPTTCFETFPLPWPPGHEPEDDPRHAAIAEAARTLNELRERWLNPPDAAEAELKKRTLTNLYNARPAWLAHAHAALDRAVWAAYGWDEADLARTSDEAILERLLALNRERAGGGIGAGR